MGVKGHKTAELTHKAQVSCGPLFGSVNTVMAKLRCLFVVGGPRPFFQNETEKCKAMHALTPPHLIGRHWTTEK